MLSYTWHSTVQQHNTTAQHTTTTRHYTTLHYTTLHYTTLHYTTLHYTTLHYTTLHYTTRHYTTLMTQHSRNTKLVVRSGGASSSSSSPRSAPLFARGALLRALVGARAPHFEFLYAHCALLTHSFSLSGSPPAIS